MQIRRVTVMNPSGLHMRPAGVFVRSISPFDSDVTLNVRGSDYNAKSMMMLLSASVKSGDEIELKIAGNDETECMKAAVAAIESGLGE